MKAYNEKINKYKTHPSLMDANMTWHKAQRIRELHDQKVTISQIMERLGLPRWAVVWTLKTKNETKKEMFIIERAKPKW